MLPWGSVISYKVLFGGHQYSVCKIIEFIIDDHTILFSLEKLSFAKKKIKYKKHFLITNDIFLLKILVGLIFFFF